MSVLTEAALRILLKDEDLDSLREYRVAEGVIVTPSARSYLTDHRIDLIIGDKRVIKNPPGRERAQSGEAANQQQTNKAGNTPEYMTSLRNRITDRVVRTLPKPRIPVEASGRHMHISKSDLEALFGPGFRLTKRGDLSQPGQFSCMERVRIIGARGEFPSVVILGPERSETQVEVSLTDAKLLGIDAPVRLSGDTADTPGIKIIGPAGELEISRGVIVAKRHVHMAVQDAATYGLNNGQIVSIRFYGERAITFHEVPLRVSPDFATGMHIDYDEANAMGFKSGMVGFLEQA